MSALSFYPDAWFLSPILVVLALMLGSLVRSSKAGGE